MLSNLQVISRMTLKGAKKFKQGDPPGTEIIKDKYPLQFLCAVIFFGFWPRVLIGRAACDTPLCWLLAVVLIITKYQLQVDRNWWQLQRNECFLFKKNDNEAARTRVAKNCERNGSPWSILAYLTMLPNRTWHCCLPLDYTYSFVHSPKSKRASTCKRLMTCWPCHWHWNHLIILSFLA